MRDNHIADGRRGFGTAPVFLTSVSSILGAILFLRFGAAVGTLGFWGALVLILLGHLITIPTALAISELATNTRVEGGGEYFIISRSFGLKIGSTIGVALFLAQAISIAFYTIAFAEAFQPLFDWFEGRVGFALPRQAVSVPTLLVFAYLFLKRGAGSGVVLLYVVSAMLALSIVLFLVGEPTDGAVAAVDNFGFFNGDRFFVLFAICFPAFTGMTAGVGLSGDLREPGRSIPLGTMLGTLTGAVVYLLVVWKLAVSAPQAELLADQMIMSRIALFGALVVPLGLAAATASSALGAMMVAPRTLQAIATDRTFPFQRLNAFFASGVGPEREPRNASVVTFAIALVFVLAGNVDSVARIISMFFLIGYGTLCLSSFLNHFGSPPSYRPRFRSRWYVSLGGFALSVWVMFRIDPLYTLVAYAIIVGVYLYIERANRTKKGLVNIFRGALFQLNRRLQVYMQKHRESLDREEWRPAAICISSHSFEREKVLDLMRWISYRHGFGTYFHYIEGYFNPTTHAEAGRTLGRLVKTQKERGSTLYLDTMISPSYTSAIAQVIQAPSISGMDNNLVLFEYDRRRPDEALRIMDNVPMVRAGGFDLCVFALSEHRFRPRSGIHVWIRDVDERNTNFMILLGYIILSHPDWRASHIKLFVTRCGGDPGETMRDLQRRIASGRLPITLNNIEIVPVDDPDRPGEAVRRHSRNAALTLIGLPADIPDGRDPAAWFAEFDDMGDVLFVDCCESKEIG